MLELWAGLGYYRRARMLHAGARDVVSRYHGRVPEEPAARLSLPGVGRYTAGAIGSIAFDRPEPAVDGNVMRVLARFYGIDSALERASTQRALFNHASALDVGDRPGDLNQALMDLGAAVCAPKLTRCEACPIATGCVARRDGRVDELPVPKAHKAPVRVEQVAVVATCRGRVALVAEPGSLFAGLLGLPGAESQGREAARAALRTSGVRARLRASPAGRLVHVLSHRHLVVEVWRATAARATHARWVTREEIDEVATSTFARRCIATAFQRVATKAV